MKGGVRLADVAGGRRNNFDSLRLIAALLVMLDHAFPLQGRAHVFGDDILGFTWGILAVNAFFVISGFLIAKSWLDDSRPGAFVVKRALRLMPALVVAVLVCAFVIGPVATTLPLSDYLRDAQTWAFVTGNVRVFPIEYVLPGVFAQNPYPLAVNGSLWTLPIEVVAYVVILALGWSRALRRRGIVVGALAVTILMRWQLASDRWLGSGTWFHMSTVQLWDLVSIFLIGSVLYLYRDRVVLSGRVALGLLVAYALAVNTPLKTAAFDVALPYCLLWLAFADLPWLRRLARPGDVSYGVYIYAFPVQQLLAAHRPNMDPWLSLLLTVPVTYAVALVSWRLVEKPSLGLKRYLRRSTASRMRRAPASGAS
jgi:peptidoglycan/LPS O-acetylase OafA/YrhL